MKCAICGMETYNAALACDQSVLWDRRVICYYCFGEVIRNTLVPDRTDADLLWDYDETFRERDGGRSWRIRHSVSTGRSNCGYLENYTIEPISGG